MPVPRSMQAIGYALGTGAGRVLGEIATYVGFELLAFIEFVMIRKSFRRYSEATFDATRGVGPFADFLVNQP